VSSERGSASLVVVAMLGAIIVLALGAVDVGRVLAAASRAQTGADAAALAAAQDLAVPSGADPSATAAEYAVRNGAALVSCDCSAGGFEADVRVQMPAGALFLAPDDLVVTADATAVVEVPGS
jgi:DNA topoisomerase I